MPSKSLQSLKYCICRTLKEAPNVNRGLISTTAAESVHEFVLQTHLIMRQGRRCPILACRQQTSHRLCCVLLSLTTQREQKALHRCWEGGGVIFFFFSSGRFQRPLRWSNSSNKKRLEAELVLQTVEIISVCLRVNEDHPTVSHT